MDYCDEITVFFMDYCEFYNNFRIGDLSPIYKGYALEFSVNRI